jgi:peptide/nickel transport system substrate-binding protein
MKLRNYFIIFTTIGILLLSMAGCGQKAVEIAGTKEETEKKTIAIGVTFAPGNLDPAQNYNGWYVVTYGIGEALVKTGKDMKLEPWLADSWTRVDDVTWKIKIKDNVMFHSGKKVTGDAVKASLERLIEMNSRASLLLDIDSIEANGNEITVKNNHPNPSFMNALADPFGVVVDVDAANAMGEEFAEKPVLTGPYKVKDYVKDEQIVVERNDSYWGDQAKLDEVTFKFIPDGNTRMMALQSGELQVTENVPLESLKVFAQNKDFQVLSESSVRTHMLIFNLKKPGLDDINVRKAINMAINRQDLGDKVMEGYGIPAVGPFPLVLPFGGDELKGYTYQPDEAKKLLENAGWEMGPDNVRRKNGNKLEFTVLCYNSRPELPVLLETIQGQLKEIGIKIDIVTMEKVSNKLKEGDFDASIYSLNTATTGDPQYLLEVMFRTGASSNFGEYSNSELDALADRLQTTFDTQERNSIAKQAQQVILDDAAFAFLVYPKRNVVINNKVKGIEVFPSEYYLLNSDVTVRSNIR